MKRIISIRMSTFLILCYLQAINSEPQPVTTQKSADIGILLTISITDKFGKEISHASFTTAAAGLATDSLTFNFQDGPNAIHVYNDSCGTTNKQEIGKLLVARKDAPKGSEIVLQGTTSEIRISIKKNISKEIPDEKEATPSTAKVPSKQPITPPVPQEKLAQPKPMQESASRDDLLEQIQRGTKLRKTPTPAKTTPAITAPKLKPKTTPAIISETSVVPSPTNATKKTETPPTLQEKPEEKSAQPGAMQKPASKGGLLEQIKSGIPLKKAPTKEQTKSTDSGSFVTTELSKKLAERRKAVEEEETQEDVDADDWD